MRNTSLRKLREILRLKFDSKLKNRAIARSLKVSPGTVSNYTRAFTASGLAWPLAEDLDDDKLESLLQAATSAKSQYDLVSPDFALIHQELKKKGVTLQLLWEEYQAIYGPRAYKRTQFCDLYRQWRQHLSVVMRQIHKAGDKLFIDYCGPTMPVIDAATGEIQQAQIFVAVLGASNYTFAEATWSQRLSDWTGSHVRAFSYFGGVPALLVPDNLKSCTTKACRYEPDINPTYANLVSHYGTAVLPARPIKPRDKAKVENGVLLVERWIMARLRNQKFFSLVELNQSIKELLIILNEKPFKKLPGSRRSQFEVIDKPALKPLPTKPYTYTEFKKTRVNIDYHIEIDCHYYSVPYKLVKQAVETRFSTNIVEIFHKNKCIATHLRSYRKGTHTTIPEHMPKKHQKHLEWSPGRFLNWAQSIGPNTLQLTQVILNGKKHPEQGYRACLGLLNLEKRFGESRLESASNRAIYFKTPTRRSVLSILEKGLDKQPISKECSNERNVSGHENIRGPEYFSTTEET